MAGGILLPRLTSALLERRAEADFWLIQPQRKPPRLHSKALMLQPVALHEARSPTYACLRSFKTRICIYTHMHTHTLFFFSFPIAEVGICFKPF